jgi:hypothetical protein
VTLTLTVQSYFQEGVMLPGVDVALCDRQDVTCAHPKASGTTDPAGGVVLEFPNVANLSMLGLDAYLQLRTPDDAEAAAKIVPWLYYFGFPLSQPQYVATDSPSATLAIRVETIDDANRLAASVGITYDPSAGYLIAIPTDCEFRRASGLRVTTDPSYPMVQTIYGLDRSNTSTDAVTGFASFVGLPAGSVDVIATPLALGNKPSSRETVNVRSGWTTAVTMLPTP